MADQTKVPIELSPYNAVKILSFCREFINDDLIKLYMFDSIREAVDELELQLANNLTDEQWQEIYFQQDLDTLIGRVPNRTNGDSKKENDEKSQ